MRSSAIGPRLEHSPIPCQGRIGDFGLGSAPCPENFLILESQNAYFGAFSGPLQSDYVVPAIGQLYGIFGGRALSNKPLLQTGLTNSQQHLESADWIELTML